MAKPAEVPDIEVRPVLDERGFVIVFDLWIVTGRQTTYWIGSRRTPEQCEDWLSHFLGVPIHATSGTPW